MSERCTDDRSSAHLLEALRMTSTTRNMASPNAVDASLAPDPTAEISAVNSNAVETQRGPPPESKEGTWLRRAAILSFWAVVVLLGLPIWWKTTAIYRAELPLQDMTDWAEGKVYLASQPLLLAILILKPDMQACLPSTHRCRILNPLAQCTTAHQAHTACH